MKTIPMQGDHFRNGLISFACACFGEEFAGLAACAGRACSVKEGILKKLC